MRIDSFNFPSGKSLASKYEVVRLIGKGWEGEVYLIRESATKIERAAKFFFPHRNKNEKSSKYYAKKLHKLNNCNIVMQYHFQGAVVVKGQTVHYLVSDFLQGEMLSGYVSSRYGKKLPVFEALHILHALVEGLLEVHKLGEYHGDLHTDNIMIKRKGLGFTVRVFDLYNSGSAKGRLRKDDIIDLINVFYEILGGKKVYSKLPSEVKEICCGLKHSLIIKKFPNLRKLKDHLESISWD